MFQLLSTIAVSILGIAHAVPFSFFIQINLSKFKPIFEVIHLEYSVAYGMRIIIRQRLGFVRDIFDMKASTLVISTIRCA